MMSRSWLPYATGLWPGRSFSIPCSPLAVWMDSRNATVLLSFCSGERDQIQLSYCTLKYDNDRLVGADDVDFLASDHESAIRQHQRGATDWSTISLSSSFNLRHEYVQAFFDRRTDSIVVILSQHHPAKTFVYRLNLTTSSLTHLDQSVGDANCVDFSRRCITGCAFHPHRNAIIGHADSALLAFDLTTNTWAPIIYDQHAPLFQPSNLVFDRLRNSLVCLNCFPSSSLRRCLAFYQEPADPNWLIGGRWTHEDAAELANLEVLCLGVDQNSGSFVAVSDDTWFSDGRSPFFNVSASTRIAAGVPSITVDSILFQEPSGALCMFDPCSLSIFRLESGHWNTVIPSPLNDAESYKQSSLKISFDHRFLHVVAAGLDANGQSIYYMLDGDGTIRVVRSGIHEGGWKQVPSRAVDGTFSPHSSLVGPIGRSAGHASIGWDPISSSLVVFGDGYSSSDTWAFDAALSGGWKFYTCHENPAPDPGCWPMVSTPHGLFLLQKGNLWRFQSQENECWVHISSDAAMDAFGACSMFWDHARQRLWAIGIKAANALGVASYEPNLGRWHVFHVAKPQEGLNFQCTGSSIALAGMNFLSDQLWVFTEADCWSIYLSSVCTDTPITHLSPLEGSIIPKPPPPPSALVEAYRVVLCSESTISTTPPGLSALMPDGYALLALLPTFSPVFELESGAGLLILQKDWSDPPDDVSSPTFLAQIIPTTVFVVCPLFVLGHNNRKFFGSYDKTPFHELRNREESHRYAPLPSLHQAYARGSKLGGLPHWIQGDDTPKEMCMECHSSFRWVGQLGEDLFDGFVLYIWVCPAGHSGVVVMQC